MRQYLAIVRNVLDRGDIRGDRTGTGTLSVFGRQMRFNLQSGFPLLTAKHTSFKQIAAELLWFISGSTNISDLHDLGGGKIWDDWADPIGDLGPIYGKQWRGFRGVGSKGVDQLQEAIKQVKVNPESRRILVSAWDPLLLPNRPVPSENPPTFQALAPCHVLFQFHTRMMTQHDRCNILAKSMPDVARPIYDMDEILASEVMNKLQVPKRYLDIRVDQRSADVFLGLPYNIASYALLCSIVARITGTEPGELVWQGGDCHLYSNHIEQAQEMLSRSDMPALPLLHISDDINRFSRIDDVKMHHLELRGYRPLPSIKAPIAV